MTIATPLLDLFNPCGDAVPHTAGGTPLAHIHAPSFIDDHHSDYTRVYMMSTCAACATPGDLGPELLQQTSAMSAQRRSLLSISRAISMWTSNPIRTAQDMLDEFGVLITVVMVPLRLRSFLRLRWADGRLFRPSSFASPA